MSPEKLLYNKTHEWVRLENDSQGQKVATIGISAFAVEALTDLVFMQLPKVGRKVKLEVEREGKRRKVTLKLREVI